MDVVELDDGSMYVYLSSVVVRIGQVVVIMLVLVSPPKAFFDGIFDQLNLLVLEASRLKLLSVRAPLIILE